MAFRFSTSKKILPGVSVNVSTSGPSVSIGPKHAKLNISKRGVRATVSIPKTGISFSKKIGK